MNNQCFSFSVVLFAHQIFHLTPMIKTFPVTPNTKAAFLCLLDKLNPEPIKISRQRTIQLATPLQIDIDVIVERKHFSISRV